MAKKSVAAIANKAVNSAPVSAPGSASFSQPPLTFKRTTSESVDEAVARFFFGNNVSVRAVQSKTFKEMIKAIRTAPLEWQPPTEVRLGGKCLQDLCRKLREEEAPLRQALLRNSGTVLSDGWDSVDRTHLINQLIGTSAGIFFSGTVALKSHDHEDAPFIAEVFSAVIDTTGPLAIVQVCTDTCSTMKAAWRILERKYPWISATPCGIHVLSLELKDLCKLPAIAEVTAKVKTILSLFWGKRRWPRNRLREVIKENHGGKGWGLYRSKVTRMAGTIKKMARLLRSKSDL